MKLHKVFSILLFLFFITSCVSKKDIVYFNEGEINQSTVSTNYQTIYKPGDMLQITVSASDMEAVKDFNLSAVTFNTTTDRASGAPTQQHYLVDNEGYIIFPVFGKLKIGGLTRNEAVELFKNKLDPDYVKSPSINIRISNFTVTILGDIKNPGTYTIPNERITLLQAIGLAGDLNISGKRNNIIVERNFKKHIVDLTSNTVFSSPVYFLQQNDLVYVEPNKAASQNAAYNSNSGLFISLGSVIISLISILTR